VFFFGFENDNIPKYFLHVHETHKTQNQLFKHGPGHVISGGITAVSCLHYTYNLAYSAKNAVNETVDHYDVQEFVGGQ